ncbi:MAG: ATP-binding cassette domain-containing protein [Desulfurococcales archaeon]|nr:ATP-binding cassette domain-containing protein [Desulfurococcales archaeon]
MIEFQNVTKIYPGEVPALSDVSFTINKRDFVFIVGSSGAGKTTVLRLISAREFPDRGRVIVDGQDTAKLSLNQISRLRRKFGVVFQDLKLLNDRTVYDNVVFALQVLGVKRKRISRKVMGILSQLGISHRRFNYPGQLSEGEKQLAAIARALVIDPLFILADEPTRNLDRETAREIISIFEAINAGGTGIILATQDVPANRVAGSRVLSLDKGRLQPESPASTGPGGG